VSSPDLTPVPSAPLPTLDDEIYNKLVETQGDIQGLLAYGLFRQSERDWIKRFFERESRMPNDGEVAKEFYFAYDAGDIERLRTQAESDMLAFAFSIVEDQRPEIEEAARREARDEKLDEIAREVKNAGRVWRAIWTGVVSSLVFAVLTLVFVAIYFGPLGLRDITKAIGH
jgi:hypothetical protein